MKPCDTCGSVHSEHQAHRFQKATVNLTPATSVKLTPSVNLTAQAPVKLTASTPSDGCARCFELEVRIAELEAQLATRKEYMREYMRRRRAKSTSS